MSTRPNRKPGLHDTVCKLASVRIAVPLFVSAVAACSGAVPNSERPPLRVSVGGVSAFDDGYDGRNVLVSGYLYFPDHDLASEAATDARLVEHPWEASSGEASATVPFIPLSNFPGSFDRDCHLRYVSVQGELNLMPPDAVMLNVTDAHAVGGVAPAVRGDAVSTENTPDGNILNCLSDTPDPVLEYLDADNADVP